MKRFRTCSPRCIRTKYQNIEFAHKKSSHIKSSLNIIITCTVYTYIYEENREENKNIALPISMWCPFFEWHGSFSPKCYDIQHYLQLDSFFLKGNAKGVEQKVIRKQNDVGEKKRKLFSFTKPKHIFYTYRLQLFGESWKQQEKSKASFIARAQSVNISRNMYQKRKGKWWSGRWSDQGVCVFSVSDASEPSALQECGEWLV